MRKRAGVIITDGMQVLVMRRYRQDRGTYFTLIGGGVEADETPAEAAVREAKEETGLNVILDASFIVANDFDEREHTYFVVREWSGEPRLGGEEAENRSDDNRWELVWMPIQHLRAFSVRPEAAVERFLSML